MQAIDFEAAARQPLFTGLGEDHLSRLLESATMRCCAANSVLFVEGDMPQALHVLISGRVELYKEHDPQECGLILLNEGDVFMPAAALFDEAYLNSARTLTKSRILLLPAAAAREAFTTCHQFAINVGRVLAGQFRMATRHIIDLKCRTAPQRLAAFLVRLVDESKSPNVADLPVSKRHLACRLGMSPETLSRTFQMLADSGLLVRGRMVHLADRKKIEEFCGPALYADATEKALGVRGI